jgi:hypothetical protein
VGIIVSTIASVIVGGIVAAATVIGVVNSQTGAHDDSPGNVNQPVVSYGSTN